MGILEAGGPFRNDGIPGEITTHNGIYHFKDQPHTWSGPNSGSRLSYPGFLH